MSPIEPFPTGIDPLDRRLDGGIPPGTVTALSASPASQSELLLAEFAATRQTTYLSALRPGADVADTLAACGVESGTVETVQLDAAEPIDHARAVLPDIDDGVTLVVDPVDVLESGDDDRYRQFLGDLKDRVSGTSSLAVVHCLSDEPVPARRRDTLSAADLVFELATEVHGESVENRLTVPKFRGGQAVEDVVKLDLTSEVEVDRTRNIL